MILPSLEINEIEQSELPHANSSPNSWGAHATEFTKNNQIEEI